jgi:hypothetical protein
VARGWLDRQIQFDSVWEGKVVERILHNLSLLMERSFASVQELNRYRKEVTAKLAAAACRGRAVRRSPGAARGLTAASGLLEQLRLLGLAVRSDLLRARPLADEAGVALRSMPAVASRSSP